MRGDAAPPLTTSSTTTRARRALFLHPRRHPQRPYLRCAMRTKTKTESRVSSRRFGRGATPRGGDKGEENRKKKCPNAPSQTTATSTVTSDIRVLSLMTRTRRLTSGPRQEATPTWVRLHDAILSLPPITPLPPSLSPPPHLDHLLHASGGGGSSSLGFDARAKPSHSFFAFV